MTRLDKLIAEAKREASSGMLRVYNFQCRILDIVKEQQKEIEKLRRDQRPAKSKR